MEKYVLGVDFGTLSVRAVLLRARDGAQLATASRSYGAYDTELPGGVPLRPLGCGAVPEEYRSMFAQAVRETVRLADVPKEDIAGIAVDSTSCTLVTLDAEGVPLCERERFRREPDAYIKVWKSHSAEAEARRLMRCAQEMGEPFLNACGHKVSSEWFYPKMLETLWNAPQVYEAVQSFLDCADWINFLLTGKIVRSINAMGIKGFLRAGRYPSEAFLRAVDPAFAGANAKVSGPLARWGERVGSLTEQAAAWLGLPAGIAVGCGSIDGHVAVAALGMRQDGDLLLSLGTSNVEALLSATYSEMPGICAMARDAAIPGFTLYDAGQAACGDMLAWYMENMLPQAAALQAQERGISPHTLLSERGLRTPPDPQGLVALDWFNGNRCPHARADLRGRIDGLSLRTRPEQIYRALVEAMGFGARQILETMEQNGCAIRRVIACGGTAVKNPDIVQCYADLLGREILVAPLENAAANGCGVLAAAAAGLYPTLSDAIDAMCTGTSARYTPTQAFHPAYDCLYARYRRLGEQALADAAAD